MLKKVTRSRIEPMLNKDQKRAEIIQQLDEEILPDIKEFLVKTVDQMLEYKAIPEDYMEEKSALLVKAAIFYFCKYNPYGPLTEQTRKEYEGLDLKKYGR